MAYVETVLGMVPQPFRDLALRHAEFIKFAIVGGTTFVADMAVFYALRMTVLEPKPLTAKIISGVLAMILSYYLNRQWSFRSRGGRQMHHEAVLFFVVSGIGVVLSLIPLWFSQYVLQLNAQHHSLMVENIADFISAYIVGNVLQMLFRFWSMRKWVFPHEEAEAAVAVDVSDAPGMSSGMPSGSPSDVTHAPPEGAGPSLAPES